MQRMSQPKEEFFWIIYIDIPLANIKYMLNTGIWIMMLS